MRFRLKNLLLLLLVFANYRSLGQCAIQTSSDTLCGPGSVVLTSTLGNYSERAFSFDGINDIIEIPNVSKYHFGSSQDFTVEFWMKGSLISSSIKWILTNSGFSVNPRWQVGVQNGVVRASIGDGTNTSAGTGSILIADGNWHHIAVSYDRSSNMTIYVDGQQDFQSNISFVGSVTNSIPIGIGGSTAPNGNHAHFNGQVDEVRIWSTVRSQANILSTMNTIINPSLFTDLIGYYDFNDQIPVALVVDCTSSPSNGTPLFGASSLPSTAIPIIQLPRLWSTTDTSQSITVYVTANQDFWVQQGWCKYICIDTMSIYVTGNGSTSFLPNDTSICSGDSFWLKPTEPFDSIVWNNGSIADSLLIASGGSYWAHLEKDGCIVTDSLTVTEITGFSSISTEETLCEGATFTATIPSSPNQSILWFDGASSIQRSFTNTGIYWVQRSNDCFLVTDTFRLTYLDCDTIPISPTDTVSRIFVPTAFTPNGDGINDFFTVQGTGINDFSIRIFDRWGTQLLYSVRMENYWDGTYKGELVAQGVYSYFIEYRTWNRKYRAVRGSVTLYY